MTGMREMLKGKKTYMVAGTVVLKSAFLVYIGEMSLVTFLGSQELNVMLAGMGLASVRAAVQKFVTG